MRASFVSDEFARSEGITHNHRVRNGPTESHNRGLKTAEVSLDISVKRTSHQADDAGECIPDFVAAEARDAGGKKELDDQSVWQRWVSGERAGQWRIVKTY